MIFTAFLINTTLLALALVNFFAIRKPVKGGTQKSVTVLLPVRNEEANIERVLTELSHQVDIEDLRVLVLNDNSEDRTLEIAEKFSSSRIVLMNCPTPQDGWLGKVSALQYGFESIKQPTDYIISIDADVSFTPSAFASAITTTESLNLDFISPYPRQIAITWMERLIQPLLQWSWMSTLLLRGSEKFPLQSTVVCNGQFLVLKYSALQSIGGFESVAHKVLDDIELGRSLVKSGFKGVVIDGSSLASTRMYSSFSQVRAGYAKSLHTAFGSITGSLFASLFMAFSGLLPFFYALQGNPLAIAAAISITATRALSAVASSTRVRDALLHPLSVTLFLYLLYYSWAHRGNAQWKGRAV
jgi:cellulose synthase/poly-beta-1,6-N-acetylglucosamine synthase-like glycosyltransferase